MSKLLNQYTELKKNDDSSIYIFRSGIFYNCLNEDAHLLQNKLGLKITNLSPEIEKCGFPINSLSKYKTKLDYFNIKYVIVDEIPEPTITEYYNNIEIKKILNKIRDLDLNCTSPINALNILNDIHQKLKNIP